MSHSFKKAYKKDLETLKEKVGYDTKKAWKKQIEEYCNRDYFTINSEETFAELFCEKVLPTSHKYKSHWLSNDMPECSKLMDKFFKQINVDPTERLAEPEKCYKIKPV